MYTRFQGYLLWNINKHLKMKDRESKVGFFWGWVPVGGGGQKEKVNEGEYGGFILYENRRMKPFEIQTRGKGMREDYGMGKSNYDIL
jgi:hypothetical protein